MRCSKHLHLSYFFTCWFLPSKLLQWTANILHLGLSIWPEWDPSVPVHWSNIHIETIASRQFVQLPGWPAVTEKIADIVWQELALPHVMQFHDKLNQITPHSGYQIDPETQKVMVGNLTIATELSEVQPSEVSLLPARPINTLSSLPSSSSPLSSTAHHPSTLSQRRAPRSTLISLSTQYEWKPLYFCISNVSHWHRLIAMHCTNVVPPAAYASLCDCSLTLHVQVTPFTQHHFSIEQSVCDLGHFQQFRQCLIEPAGIHMQQHSQNLVKPVPPPYYCGNIVVLFIVLYCITLTTVSCLTCTVAGTTSHTTHCTVWLLSQVACLYSLLFSCSTLPLMCT